ncbi:MAG TPA: ATP-binding protein [Planctomycetota bacterium]
MLRVAESPPAPSLADRRVRFLRVANRCWLALGFLGLIVWPIYPTETLFFTVLLGSTGLTFLLVEILIRKGRIRTAAVVFCVLSNQTLYALILLNHAVHGFHNLEANLTRVAGLAMMGLSIIFAGATIGPGAAFAFAGLNVVLLSAAVLFVDTRLGPKISIPFFWAVLAVSVWLYEKHVKEAVDGLQAARDTLERAVDERTRELRLAKEDVEDSNKELEAFAYSAAHDLKAPLRRIDGLASLLEEDTAGQLKPGSASLLAVLRKESGRMTRLIEDLLNLSRVSRAPLRRTSVDLSTLAGEIAKELASRDPSRRVEWAIAPGLRVDADPGLTRILLENLLGNAWKFTAKTEAPRIELGWWDGFFVRDNGAGFDMASVDRLFRPFERLHADADFAGSGIGLTIVHRIVQRHGGSVRAEGEVGHGAKITFTL